MLGLQNTIKKKMSSENMIAVVQLLSCVWLFATPWTAACQASYPSPAPRACSNSYPSSQWCHPTISSSVVPFSSCLQSFPASGSFPMSQFFPSGGQRIGASASALVLPMNIQDWFSLRLTGLISCCPGDSQESSPVALLLIASSPSPLEKEMATHSSTLAWIIPWKEEPSRLQSTRVAKSWTGLSDFTFTFSISWVMRRLSHSASSTLGLRDKHSARLLYPGPLSMVFCPQGDITSRQTQ